MAFPSLHMRHSSAALCAFGLHSAPHRADRLSKPDAINILLLRSNEPERVARTRRFRNCLLKPHRAMPIPARRGLKAARRNQAEIRSRESNFLRYALTYSAQTAGASSSLRCRLITFATSSPLSNAINIPLPVKGSMNAAESPIASKPLVGLGCCRPKRSHEALSHSESRCACSSV